MMEKEQKKPRPPKKFGGFTLEEIDAFVKASEEQGESFDWVAGGDLAHGCNVVRELVVELRAMSQRLAQASKTIRNLKDAY
jgi:hypothetical protein